MSIIVSVKINDGIVMAADSAITFYKPNGEPGQIYESANKIVNLVKGLPIGVMTCGAGGIGSASVDTLLKDLRVQLGMGGAKPVDPENYTVEEIATDVKTFFAEKIRAIDFKGVVILKICGYSSNAPLSEVWHVGFADSQCYGPMRMQSQDDSGIRWDGETEALNRLVTGIPERLAEAVVSEGILTKEQYEAAVSKLYPRLGEILIMTAAPIQDAIDLARYLVETTAGFIRFSVARAKTVGGTVEIASITKHEGFRWVQRKHFYQSDLNPA